MEVFHSLRWSKIWKFSMALFWCETHLRSILDRVGRPIYEYITCIKMYSRMCIILSPLSDPKQTLKWLPVKEVCKLMRTRGKSDQKLHHLKMKQLMASSKTFRLKCQVRCFPGATWLQLWSQHFGNTLKSHTRSARHMLTGACVSLINAFHLHDLYQRRSQSCFVLKW